ncbi:hypothetical protein GCM10010341_06730 [Streptomyces noursei]|nr:hypothetical protein GCM10010341_06730 [Streptomyces noursei]
MSSVTIWAAWLMVRIAVAMPDHDNSGRSAGLFQCQTMRAALGDAMAWHITADVLAAFVAKFGEADSEPPGKPQSGPARAP